MASGRAYWYPDPAGTLESTDIGTLWSDIQEPDSAIVADTYGGDGTPFRDHYASVKRIRFVFERFGVGPDDPIEQAWKSMETHLFKGGYIGIAGDHLKAWATLASSSPSRGDGICYCGLGNGFTAWSPLADMVAGDEVVIESPHPEAQREYRKVDVGGGSPRTQVVVTTPVIYTYAGSTLVRHRDFYPVCWLPKDQVGKPIVFGDHRRNFTLDVTLEYCLAATIALFEDGELPSLRSVEGFAGGSLEEILGSPHPVLGGL